MSERTQSAPILFRRHAAIGWRVSEEDPEESARLSPLVAQGRKREVQPQGLECSSPLARAGSYTIYWPLACPDRPSSARANPTNAARHTTCPQQQEPPTRQHFSSRSRAAQTAVVNPVARLSDERDPTGSDEWLPAGGGGREGGSAPPSCCVWWWSTQRVCAAILSADNCAVCSVSPSSDVGGEKKA